ncbi:unnamed protein product [Parnassius apollo]|uniref:(apollo) hypothetical protein n=1 Tax=Parnassius apollo TaxID=110799 RepID=A0A8S3X7G9_PARAO|nr:unnamed protein product [Parnassius apollo]
MCINLEKVIEQNPRILDLREKLNEIRKKQDLKVDKTTKSVIKYIITQQFSEDNESNESGPYSVLFDLQTDPTTSHKGVMDADTQKVIEQNPRILDLQEKLNEIRKKQDLKVDKTTKSVIEYIITQQFSEDNESNESGPYSLLFDLQTDPTTSHKGVMDADTQKVIEQNPRILDLREKLNEIRKKQDLKVDKTTKSVIKYIITQQFSEDNESNESGPYSLLFDLQTDPTTSHKGVMDADTQKVIEQNPRILDLREKLNEIRKKQDLKVDKTTKSVIKYIITQQFSEDNESNESVPYSLLFDLQTDPTTSHKGVMDADTHLREKLNEIRKKQDLKVDKTTKSFIKYIITQQFSEDNESNESGPYSLLFDLQTDPTTSHKGVMDADTRKSYNEITSNHKPQSLKNITNPANKRIDRLPNVINFDDKPMKEFEYSCEKEITIPDKKNI